MPWSLRLVWVGRGAKAGGEVGQGSQLGAASGQAALGEDLQSLQVKLTV